MLSKCSLRLKLSDFINSDIEEMVMSKINAIHNELNVTVLLYLWFEEEAIVSKDLKEFLMRWEKKLTFKTIVKQGYKLHHSEFIFFDIIPTGTPDNIAKRFSFNYINANNILVGLSEFYNVVNFTTSEKPTKRQKRNDYED